MKRIFILVFLIICFFAPVSGLDFHNRFSVMTNIPMKDNAYNAVWGGKYGFKLTENRFIFILGAGVNFGASRAKVSIEDENARIYGLYKNDWYILKYGEGSSYSPSSSVFYLSGELSATFGWHLSYIFERDQYIFVTLSSMLESETFSGDIEKQFLAGRYMTYITFSTGIFTLRDNPVFLDLSFGSASLQEPSAGGNAFYFLRTAVSYEIGGRFAETVDTYERSRDIEKEKNKTDDKGGTLWEESK